MFASKEVAEERQIASAEAWRKAKRSWQGFGFGCLFFAILAALALAYIAGAVSSAIKPDDCTTKPTHVSTP